MSPPRRDHRLVLHHKAAPVGDPTLTGPAQFERPGSFTRDPDSTPERPVFNRTVGLRDTWAKVKAAGDSAH